MGFGAKPRLRNAERRASLVVLVSLAVPILQAAAVLIGISTVTGYLPARRAARVDPLVALQDE